MLWFITIFVFSYLFNLILTHSEEIQNYPINEKRLYELMSL